MIKGTMWCPFYLCICERTYPFIDLKNSSLLAVP